MVGLRRGGRLPVPASGCGLSRTSTRPRSGRGRGAQGRLSGSCTQALAAARREIHLNAEAGELRHGASIQFNTVASACMKMLNALERAPARERGRRAARRGAGRGHFHPAAGALADHAAHQPRPVARARLRRGHPRTRPGPSPTPAALEQDEIELVLQVERQAARQHPRRQGAPARTASKPLALANEQVQKFIAGQTVKKIVVVPGRLVNVVV